MLKAKKEELQERGYKGFTLMEMLIVVAIIAVLIAIAIPVFTDNLERSKEATDMANIRAAYSEVVVAYLEDGKAHEATVSLQSNTNDWKSAQDAKIAGVVAKNIIGTGGATSIKVACTNAGAVTIGGQPADTSQLDS